VTSKPLGEGLGITAVFLLVFLIVVGVAIWLVDLIAQQSVFGLLASAEFLAFGMLVYLYYEENPKDVNKKWLAVGFAALFIIIGVAAAFYAGFGSSPRPNVELTLYAGEASPAAYGFGNTSTSIGSPGPTLNFRVGDVVKMTVINSGQMPHNWVISSEKRLGAQILFDAEVGTEEVPLSGGQSGSNIFTVTQAGTFYYLCEIPGHLELGMWGTVVVNP
jgi:uncharacterized cupredoxin-like copper-binding protein